MISGTPSTMSLLAGTSTSQPRGRSVAASTSCDVTAAAVSESPALHRRADRRDVAERRSPVGQSVVPALIVAAWTSVFIAQFTGAAVALHHHALIEGGQPLWLAVPLFLAAWLVMIA